MPPLDIRKYLFDILQASDLIIEFTKDKTFDDYADNPLLRSAVERQFEVIGEALNQALRLNPDLKDRISECRRIIAFRHRLIHGYDSLAHEVVWGVLEANLPALRSQVRALMESLEG